MTSFAEIPPFPDDVPTHPLYVIDLNLLEKKDENEMERLWEACTTLGFFYIKGFDESIPDNMFKLAKEALSIPIEEKLKYDQDTITKSYHGYKGLGGIIVDEKGTSDANEYYNMSKSDEIAYPEREHVEHPPILYENIQILRSFVGQSDQIVKAIMECLEIKLGVESNELLKIHTVPGTLAGQVRVIRAPAPADPNASKGKESLGEHSDIGSVSIVHNRVGGLQVSIPGTTEWKYIRPIPGHAVVNLGDVLSILTFACFTRPADPVVLTPLKMSSLVAQTAQENQKSLDEEFGTFGEWLHRRTTYRRKALYTGPQDFYRSRGMEHLNNPGFEINVK